MAAGWARRTGQVWRTPRAVSDRDGVLTAVLPTVAAGGRSDPIGGLPVVRSVRPRAREDMSKIRIGIAVWLGLVAVSRLIVGQPLIAVLALVGVWIALRWFRGDDDSSWVPAGTPPPGLSAEEQQQWLAEYWSDDAVAQRAAERERREYEQRERRRKAWLKATDRKGRCRKCKDKCYYQADIGRIETCRSFVHQSAGWS